LNEILINQQPTITSLNYLTNYALTMCMYVNSTEPSKIVGMNYEQLYTILPSV